MNRSNVQKVLMTADTVGGVWTYSVELIRALENHGVEIMLATMGRPISAEQREDLDGLQNVTVAESNFRLEWMDEPWEDVRASGEWLLRLEREFQPDLVHLNGYAHASNRWRTPLLVVGHSCVYSWFDAVKKQNAPGSWTKYWKAVRDGLQAADLVVAPTRAMLNCLVEHYGDLSATQVIPNGRNLELFRTDAPKENFVLCAGRLWDEGKNVRAVCAYSAEVTWPIWLAGETGAPSGRQPAATLGQNVRCLGRLSGREMLENFAKASIFAHPASYEPFGLSVLEGGLSGCALVLGDIPSLRENWNGAALFVDPGEPKQLRDALNGLIVKPELRRALGKAARERAERFDISTTAVRYLEAYNALVVNRALSVGRTEAAFA